MAVGKSIYLSAEFDPEIKTILWLTSNTFFSKRKEIWMSYQEDDLEIESSVNH